jgi:hypothetical protein
MLPQFDVSIFHFFTDNSHPSPHNSTAGPRGRRTDQPHDTTQYLFSSSPSSPPGRRPGDSRVYLAHGSSLRADDGRTRLGRLRRLDARSVRESRILWNEVGVVSRQYPKKTIMKKAYRRRKNSATGPTIDHLATVLPPSRTPRLTQHPSAGGGSVSLRSSLCCRYWALVIRTSRGLGPWWGPTTPMFSSMSIRRPARV